MTAPRPASPEAQRARDSAEDLQLAALRGGDPSAFRSLVTSLHPTMVRVATSYVGSRETAEEVVQDVWLAVLQQLDRFEQRSSLKTWIFRILTNQAKTRGVRERRTTPFSALSLQQEAEESVVSQEAFLAEGHRWAGHWASQVRAWEVPEEGLLSGEMAQVIRKAVDGLPPAQRAVVALRDGQGMPADEVCDLLGLSEGNQRVLLHRGRQRVRAAVAAYVEQEALA